MFIFIAVCALTMGSVRANLVWLRQRETILHVSGVAYTPTEEPVSLTSRPLGERFGCPDGSLRIEGVCLTDTIFIQDDVPTVKALFPEAEVTLMTGWNFAPYVQENPISKALSPKERATTEKKLEEIRADLRSVPDRPISMFERIELQKRFWQEALSQHRKLWEGW